MILLMELRKRIEGAMKLGIEDNGALAWVIKQIDEIADEEINNIAREKDEHNKPGDGGKAANLAFLHSP